MVDSWFSSWPFSSIGLRWSLLLLFLIFRISFFSESPPVPWTIPSDAPYDPPHFPNYETLEALRTSFLIFDTLILSVIPACLVLLMPFICQKIFNSSLDLSPKIQIHIFSWLFFISIWMADMYLKLNIAVPNTSCSPPHILSSHLFIPAIAVATSSVHIYTTNTSSRLYQVALIFCLFSVTFVWNACSTHSAILKQVQSWQCERVNMPWTTAWPVRESQSWMPPTPEFKPSFRHFISSSEGPQ